MSGLAGITALYFAFHLSTTQALALVVLVMFGVVADQVRILCKILVPEVSVMQSGEVDSWLRLPCVATCLKYSPMLPYSS